MIDKQRDQIRARDRELSQKTTEIENVNWYLYVYMQFGDFLIIDIKYISNSIPSEVL